MPFVVGQSFASASPSAGVTFIGHHENGGTAPAQTYFDKDIGPAESGRLVVVVAGGVTNNRTIDSITIDGAAMTIHDSTTGAGVGSGGGAFFHDLAIAIASKAVASGTTATIVVNFSGPLSASYIMIYNINGYTSATPHDTATGTSTGSNPSLTIDVPAAGVLIAGYAGGAVGYPGDPNTLGAVTWAGVSVEDWDEIVDTHGGVWWGSGAHQNGMSVESGRTVSATAAAPGRELLIAGTWE